MTDNYKQIVSKPNKIASICRERLELGKSIINGNKYQKVLDYYEISVAIENGFKKEPANQAWEAETLPFSLT